VLRFAFTARNLFAHEWTGNVSVIQDSASRAANRRSLDFAKRIAVGSLQSWYLMGEFALANWARPTSRLISERLEVADFVLSAGCKQLRGEHLLHDYSMIALTEYMIAAIDDVHSTPVS
jgi:hypothetical protein